jgi:hypothetical protein
LPILLALLTVTVAACGGDAALPTATTAAAPTATPPVATTTTAPSPTTTASNAASSTTSTTTTTTLPDVDVIDLDLTTGTEDFGRVDVLRGRTVRLRVTADVSDEVHVHGYDRFAEVAPDRPAIIEFVADIEGIFEVELEGARQLIVELKVES